ncbi:MAG TPA: transporter [Steroidobacteraceae bacterium]
MSATNSGVTPDSGFTYANALLYYERDRKTGPDGDTVETGTNSVFLEMNTFIWVSDGIEALGGARYSAAATVPLARNSLTSDEVGQISGATGLGDIFVQPLILGWQTARADIRLIYGFLAPTGRFDAGANDNVGSGYWTHTFSSGQTFYITEDRATAISAFEMYEVHATQEGTGIRPGDTLNLDYSVTRIIPLQNGIRLQLGLAGYEQWQTSSKTGPLIGPSEAEGRYRVNALGLASNVFLPERKLSFGLKFFKEFSTESTFEGYSLQGSFGIKF